MSLLPERKTTLDRPPALPGRVNQPRKVSRPGKPPEPPSLRPAFEAAKKNPKPIPSIMKQLGSTPWFQVSDRHLSKDDGDSEEEEKHQNTDSWSSSDEGGAEDEPVAEERIKSLPPKQEQPMVATRSFEDKSTQTDETEEAQVIEKSSLQIKELTEKCTSHEKAIDDLQLLVSKLQEEKAAWKEKIARAQEKKKSKQQTAVHGERHRRPFVSTVGDYHNHDFNAMLLDLKDVTYCFEKK